MKTKRKLLKDVNSQEAFDRHNEIKKRESMRRQLLALNIEDISKMYETQGYRVILGDDPTPPWTAYLAEVELFYSRAQVERWRRIYQKFVKEFELTLDKFFDVPETRLEDMSKVVKNKSEIDEWLNRALTATSLDWRNFIAEAMGKVTTEECEHKFKIFEICNTCGTKHAK